MSGSGVLGLFWNIFVKPTSAGGAIARGLAVAVGLLISAPLMSGFITSLLSYTPSPVGHVKFADNGCFCLACAVLMPMGVGMTVWATLAKKGDESPADIAHKSTHPRFPVFVHALGAIAVELTVRSV